MKITRFLGLALTLSFVLFASVCPAVAQNVVSLPQLVLEPKHTEYVSTQNPGTPNIVGVKSSNLSVATATVYRVSQVQIVAVALGQTSVEFFDTTQGILDRVSVWVEKSNPTGGGGGGYDPGKTQLPQIVMLAKYTQNVTVPGGGPHQLSSVVSSNPSVATARTNTVNTIQIYSVALGDTFIDFRDNATGMTFEVHVYVVKELSGPRGGSDGGPVAPGPRPLPDSRPKPMPNAGAQSPDLFNNFNPAGTVNGVRNPTVFTLSGAARITQLVTYHWYSGRGARPGFIGIRDLQGNSYGSFQARGVPGQGGAPNVNWVADVDFTLPTGTYAVTDSDRATWSSNAESDDRGFAIVRGVPSSPPGAPSVSRPATQAANLIGEWQWHSVGFNGKLRITTQNTDGTFSGEYDPQWHSRITGKVVGNKIEFLRQLIWTDGKQYQQHYTLTLTGEGENLRMVNGRWSGFDGNSNNGGGEFSAEKISGGSSVRLLPPTKPESGWLQEGYIRQ